MILAKQAWKKSQYYYYRWSWGVLHLQLPVTLGLMFQHRFHNLKSTAENKEFNKIDGLLKISIRKNAG